MRQQDVHDELRARLHEAAEAHEPDRAGMLARIERGMSEQHHPGHRSTRPPVWSWARVVGATAAAAGMLAVGGYAVASAVKDDASPQQQTVAVSPTPTPSPDATSRAPVPPAQQTPSRPPESHRASNTPSPTPTSSSPVSRGAAGTSDGPVWSDGSVDPHSNDFWAQSDITLKTSAQLTSLTVKLKVAQTGGVSTAGAWRSLPEQDFTLTVAERDGFVVYTWVLKEGRTVPKGEWVFAGQYNHARGGRDVKDDGYTVEGTAAGQLRSVSGDFASHPSDEDDS
ncbi:hypothetical protein [Streptomyces pseudovenezuelae]|uniref:Uncharacterized protein n=1 Tax=Streptomyces pseudovenezuelae TaxID=67350 RepID=A0ABT6LII1_9ACTN|nr:hypothetical protein [Streptomyces pseudovenezuelae]MDH6216111.1 hypothetical protein [Streptomyces pseudovenezuelae]